MRWIAAVVAAAATIAAAAGESDWSSPRLRVQERARELVRTMPQLKGKDTNGFFGLGNQL